MTDRVAIAALAAADPHAQEARLVDGIISIGGVSVDISGMEPMASEMLAGAGWRILPRYFAGVKCADPWGWMDSSEEAAGYWCAIDRSA